MRPKCICGRGSSPNLREPTDSWWGGGSLPSPREPLPLSAFGIEFRPFGSSGLRSDPCYDRFLAMEYDWNVVCNQGRQAVLIAASL